MVHLELHTADRSAAGGFYAGLLRWTEEAVNAGQAVYHALDIGAGIGGGLVECGCPHAVWLPYVEVDRVDEMTERAVGLGASVLLGPREGPAGWRSIVSTPEGGEIALWQRKPSRMIGR